MGENLFDWPVNLAIIVEIFETFKNLPQDCSNHRFFENAMFNILIFSSYIKNKKN